MSDSTLRYGVEFDPREDRSYQYYEREHDYEDQGSEVMKTGQEATAQMNQSPKDRASATCRFYDAAAFLAAEQAKAVVLLPGKTTIPQLPAVLLSITTAYNKSAGSGESNHPVSQMSAVVVNSGSGQLSPRSTAQASAAIVPSISWVRKDWYSKALVNCTFAEFTDVGGMSVANIITRLGGSITDLPIFKPLEVQVKLTGGQVSIQQSADTTARLAFSGDSEAYGYEYGDGFSKEVGVTERVETIPEALHDTLTISSATDTQDVTVEVDASTSALMKSASEKVAAIDNTPTALTGTASAAVVGFGLSATTPIDIPRTGVYLTEIQATPDDLSTVKYRCTLVDMTQYAG